MSVILSNNIYLTPGSFPIKKSNASVSNPSFCGEKYKLSQNNSEIKKVDFHHLRAKGINFLTSGDRRIADGSKKIYSKIQKQLNPITSEDVEQLISSVEKNGATKNEALFAMNVLTQYGNMQSLVKLGEKLKELDINKFYRGTENFLSFNFSNSETDKDFLKTNNELFVATNLAFDYLYNSKQITKLADKDNTAVILDEAMFKFLENNPEELSKLKDDENIIFINLEGWNSGLNIYTQGKDDKYIVDNTSNLIKRARDIQQNKNIIFEEVFKYLVNENVINRAKELGIEPVTISVNETQKPDVNSIVKNLAPMNISEKYIYKLINAICDYMFSENKKEAQRAKILIADYFLSQVQVYSPRRIGESLKEMHSIILDYASKNYKSDGKPYTEDDIVYITPSTRKSYDQIYLQYQKVNNIDTNKFISTIDKNFSGFPDDKIYVVIDDIVATGSSMLAEGFGYSFITTEERPAGENKHIIMAPVISSKQGYDEIKREIKKKGRTGIDEIITDEKNQTVSLTKSDFYNKLSEADKNILEKVINMPALSLKNPGSFCSEGNAVLFPYMGPDTNSILSSLLFCEMIPNPMALKSTYPGFFALAKNIKNLCGEY